MSAELAIRALKLALQEENRQWINQRSGNPNSLQELFVGLAGLTQKFMSQVEQPLLWLQKSGLEAKKELADAIGALNDTECVRVYDAISGMLDLSNELEFYRQVQALLVASLPANPPDSPQPKGQSSEVIQSSSLPELLLTVACDTRAYLPEVDRPLFWLGKMSVAEARIELEQAVSSLSDADVIQCHDAITTVLQFGVKLEFYREVLEKLAARLPEA